MHITEQTTNIFGANLNYEPTNLTKFSYSLILTGKAFALERLVTIFNQYWIQDYSFDPFVQYFLSFRSTSNGSRNDAFVTCAAQLGMKSV